jgi:hypothetical protein
VKSTDREFGLPSSLAQAETYLAVAHIIRRVNMSLVDTNMEVVLPHRDRLIILPKSGAYSTRVTVHGVESDP